MSAKNYKLKSVGGRGLKVHGLRQAEQTSKRSLHAKRMHADPTSSRLPGWKRKRQNLSTDCRDRRIATVRLLLSLRTR
jgi:hypothetical protein